MVLQVWALFDDSKKDSEKDSKEHSEEHSEKDSEEHSQNGSQNGSVIFILNMFALTFKLSTILDIGLPITRLLLDIKS